MSILIVVADGSHARILTAATRHDSLSEISDLVHPASRQRETDLISDDRGSGKDSAQPGRHSMGHEKEAHQQQKQAFARELCDEVDRLIQDGSTGKIYLVAPPAFTGMLRALMSKQALKLVVDEIEKDLVKHSLEDIRSHLPKLL